MKLKTTSEVLGYFTLNATEIYTISLMLLPLGLGDH